MSDILFSVIISNFNGENYIDKCLNSVVNQTYDNLEIIIIDDCSTDNSRLKFEEWKNKDNRIKVIFNYKNMGPGYSRNVGLNEAKGDYISFIDIDDYIELNMFERLVTVIKANEMPDIVKFQYMKELNNYKKKSQNSEYGLIKCDNDKSKFLDMFFRKHDFAQIWNAVFKRNSYICDLRFNPDYRNAQDYFYFLNAILKVNSLYVMEDFLYHWVINDKSITHSVDVNKCFDRLKLHYDIDRAVFDLVKINGYNEFDKEMLNASVSITKILLKQYSLEISYKDYLGIIKKFVNSKEHKDFCKRAEGVIDLKEYNNILFKKIKYYYFKFKVISKIKYIIKKFYKKGL